MERHVTFIMAADGSDLVEADTLARISWPELPLGAALITDWALFDALKQHTNGTGLFTSGKSVFVLSTEQRKRDGEEAYRVIVSPERTIVLAQGVSASVYVAAGYPRTYSRFAPYATRIMLYAPSDVRQVPLFEWRSDEWRVVDVSRVNGHAWITFERVRWSERIA